MNDAQHFDPPGMKFAAMSQALRCGDLILLSGQVALKDGKVVGIGDPVEQVRQCFANIEAALKEAGAGMDDIVSVRCYLVDPAAFAAYSEFKAATFKNRPPISTTVVVKDLMLPGLLLEIEAQAWVGGKRP